MNLIFLTYDNRSGSTLLSSLLNQFQGIDVLPETGFVTKIVRLGNKLMKLSSEEIVECLYSEPQFSVLGIDKNELAFEIENITKTSTIKYQIAIIEVIIKLLSKKFSLKANNVIVKSPGIVFHLDLLKKIFENFKILHVIRDGRDVFLSKRKSRSINGELMETNIIKAALDWRKINALPNRVVENVYTIRYEDLLENTDLCLSNILSFLKLNNEEKKVVKPQEEYFSRVGDNQKHLHKKIIEKPDRKNYLKWQNQMTNNEIWLYNYLTQTILKKYNYKLPKPEISYTFVNYLIIVILTYILEKIKRLYKAIFIEHNFLVRFKLKFK